MRSTTWASQLDDSPGMIRPITLNVVDPVLSRGSRPPSLDAGRLARTEQSVEQPALHGVLEQPAKVANRIDVRERGGALTLASEMFRRDLFQRFFGGVRFLGAILSETPSVNSESVF